MDATAWNLGSGSNQRLVDICSEIFYMIFHIRGGRDPGHPDTLRKEIALHLQDVDRRGKKLGLAEEDVKATRYALCALIDETILNSQWAFKDQWTDRPLQLEYFGEHMAGERFFDLLERVRQKGSRKVDLLEVFCLTLIFGFQGKYKLHGAEGLKNLVSELVGEINSHRGGRPSLSPHWKIPKDAAQRPTRLVPRWVWITAIASAVAVVVVYAVLRLWLGSSASEAASSMIL